MKRLVALGIVALLGFFSVKAWSNVCFLSDTECQGEQTATRENCADSSLTHEWKRQKCYKYSATPACNDDLGNWYDIDGCASGYTNLDNDHYCEGDTTCFGKSPRTDLKCCPEGEDRCKDASHGGKWHFCEGNAYGEGRTCDDRETTETRKKYEKCVCDRNIYKYECAGAQLRGTGGSCTDDEGRTYYASCECATGSSDILTSSIDCTSCTGTRDNGECSIPAHTPNEANPGHSCMAGTITCNQCPSEYNKSCSVGVAQGTGKKCGGGCFSEYCSTGFYATCSGCDTSYDLSGTIENANCTSCVDENGTHYNCSCNEGYRLENGSCVPAVTCSANQSLVNGKCVCDSSFNLGNQIGNASCSSCSDDSGTHYKCTCNSGYTLKDGKCEKNCASDEKLVNGKCLKLCNSYQVGSNSLLSSTILHHASCTECFTGTVDGSYFCVCDSGYHLENGECVDNIVVPTSCSYCTSSNYECDCEVAPNKPLCTNYLLGDYDCRRRDTNCTGWTYACYSNNPLTQYQKHCVNEPIEGCFCSKCGITPGGSVEVVDPATDYHCPAGEYDVGQEIEICRACPDGQIQGTYSHCVKCCSAGGICSGKVSSTIIDCDKYTSSTL